MIENFEHSIIFIGLHSWRWAHRAAAHSWAHTTAAFATEVAKAVGQGDDYVTAEGVVQGLGVVVRGVGDREVLALDIRNTLKLDFAIGEFNMIRKLPL